MMANLKIASFNCTGYKSSSAYIKDTLLGNYDLIMLQETWLLPHELQVTDCLHQFYSSTSVSSVDIGAGVLRGRPYGGLTFMYHQRWAQQVTPIIYEEKRFLGMMVSFDKYSILFINIYLPTQINQNYDEYVSCIGKLNSIISETDADAVVVAGDWNAPPGSNFYREMEHLCDEHSLIVTDVAKLPQDTFTHLSEAHNTTSWLDHILVSENISDNVGEIKVIYGGSTSNHFPLVAELKMSNIPVHENISDTHRETVKWDFMSNAKRDAFITLLDELLQTCNVNFCVREGCTNENCLHEISYLFESVQQRVKEAGEEVFGRRRVKEHVVPGWTAHVAQHHEEARRTFLRWREAGSPREGQLALYMRAARATFKRALRRCKMAEEVMRAEALASKVMSNDDINFWKDIKKSLPRSNKIPGKIDTATGGAEITNLWRESYKHLFNSVNPEASYDELLSRRCGGYGDAVSLDELREGVRGLSSGKAIGRDGVPAEVLIHASQRLAVLMATAITACFRHTYIPDSIMDIFLQPIVKNPLKSTGKSENYRPIAISTAMSKLIEKIMYNRMKEHLHITDNQFAYRSNHSTDQCVYLLKDVVNYFQRLGTPVYICFIDASKAFDRIDYNTLFKKLIRRGTPLYLVKLLCFWSINQKFRIMWGRNISEPFTIRNGTRQGGLLSPHLYNVYVSDLSVNLNNSGVGCFAGGKLVNHLYYADDLVIIAPSARALQVLLDLCSVYAEHHFILHNTDKSVYMIIWPKNAKCKHDPVFILSGIPLKMVYEYKYLGCLLTSSMKDDEEMPTRMRGIYAGGNTLISRFKVCSDLTKTKLFKAYCTNIYGCSLWSTYNVGTWRKVKVSHNDIFRTLMGVPRYESATQLFAQHNVPNLDVLVRKTMYSLMTRLERSKNPLIQAVINSEVRIHSVIWRRIDSMVGVLNFMWQV